MGFTKRMQLIVSFLFMSAFAAHTAVAKTTAVSTASGSAKVIPFTLENWEFIGTVAIEDYLGQKTLSMGEGKPPFGRAIAKGVQFENGIIEYDVAFNKARSFSGVQFRAQDKDNYEYFYMRSHQSGNPDANQYMPVNNGIDAWQIYYGEQYSKPIVYKFDEWMHVKIVVSDELADVYIMDMAQSAYTVNLKQKKMSGGLALQALNLGGKVNFANFSYAPMKSPNIVGTPVADKVAAKGSVLSWQVSNAFSESDLKGYELPKMDLTRTQLRADGSGILNLAKLQGVSKDKDTVLAKFIVTSKSKQTKKMNFGFSEKVKVYLNGQLLYAGSDVFASRDYRFLGTVGLWDSIYLQLQEGANEVEFAVTEDLMTSGGWAAQAQFDDMSDLKIEAQ